MAVPLKVKLQVTVTLFGHFYFQFFFQIFLLDFPAPSRAGIQLLLVPDLAKMAKKVATLVDS